MTTVIIGGSAGVGRELCRQLAAKGHDVTIVSRDRRDLQAESAHCLLSYGAKVRWIEADASKPTEMISAIASHLSANDLGIENLLFTVGGTIRDDDTSARASDVLSILHTNLTNVIVSVNALLPRMASDGCRNIIGFGSIAAIRGRQVNMTYSAAKRGLESYFESLRHRLANSGINVKLYRLGYVDTQQSFGQKLVISPSQPSSIARRIVADWNSDTGTVSLPRYWSVVGFALRALPWPIFRNMNF